MQICASGSVQRSVVFSIGEIIIEQKYRIIKGKHPLVTVWHEDEQIFQLITSLLDSSMPRWDKGQNFGGLGLHSVISVFEVDII